MNLQSAVVGAGRKIVGAREIERRPRGASRCAEPPMRVCRSGFTREYGSGGNGDRRVEIGQQARPFRG
ncbi:hypothetical protein [Pseudomonas putida]|uniref:hypothetical protein n=1 Tax=Pseudomonas putida TaxID=303 RepID=UPI000D346AB6|nr:hypothetical protein [Pseudomonas putida]PTV55958.1 hypothetical protein DBL05_19700 [Pseudomonas putida]